jgi:hypothetical protein
MMMMEAITVLICGMLEATLAIFSNRFVRQPGKIDASDRGIWTESAIAPRKESSVCSRVAREENSHEDHTSHSGRHIGGVATADRVCGT